MANNGGGISKTQEGLPENLRKQLAVAVRSVQWSYAIFWSLSTTQQGVLEWGEGYYNGDIKTRKTVHEAVELKPDKIALQRSEQLRDLYESLLESKTDQAKRPCAALSPEDLTDAEWYYLVCMSFVFNSGQGLPGRALGNGETIWLCNAQYADSKVFSRSLLAKSASIQTVICFPYLGGVIELGATELVPEDPSLLQHIKASLLDFSKPVCSADISSPTHKTDDDDNHMCVKVDHENIYSPAEETKYINKDGFIVDSPDECSNGCEHNHQTEDSFMLEGASQVQSWHFVDDDQSNCFQDSLNSGDCISEALANGEKKPCNVKEVRDGKHTLDLDADEEYLHYKRTLSAVLKSSNGVIKNSCFRICECKKSCFVKWRNDHQRSRPHAQQIVLKKILFNVPLMHDDLSLTPRKGSGREEKIGTDRVLSDNKRENTKFLVLRSMLPSINETDKASILNDTIKYLKELEARVEELESCMDSVDFKTRPRRNHNHADIIEQISDNCDFQKTDSNSKKQLFNKRKASDIDETDLRVLLPKDGTLSSSNVKVCIKEQEVLIEMNCPYREYILLDIMDAMNNLHLDAHTVQSSTLDGILSLTLKSKFRGAAIAPAGMINQALSKVAAEF